MTRFPYATRTYQYVDATLPDKVALRNFVSLLGCREGGNATTSKGVTRLVTELAVQGGTPVHKQTLKPVFSFPLGLYGWISTLGQPNQ
jgi:hypothetical protein